MPYFTTDDGTKLHYQVSGEGRPVLLFIHGWCSNLRHWDRQTRYFQKRHQVIRVDRPGYGRSSPPAGGTRWRDQADGIAALLRSLHARSVVAFGHAGGGPTTLELARRHPRLVKALVMVDTGAPRRGIPATEAERSPAVKSLQGEGYEAALATRYAEYFHPATPRRVVASVVADAVRTPQETLLRELRQIMTGDTVPAARRVKQPVLAVRASDTEATSESVREFMPQTQFAQVVGGGHYLHLEVPEQFNPIARRFIELL